MMLSIGEKLNEFFANIGPNLATNIPQRDRYFNSLNTKVAIP